MQILLKAIKSLQIPVVLTMHDAWTFTGHCAYFTFQNCEKWQSGCNNCPSKKEYPASFIFDFSQRNFLRKKDIFCNFDNITFVSPSDWLADLAKKSFLKDKNIITIKNGIDLNNFYKIETAPHSSFNILGVASVWSQRKGLLDFFEIRKRLDSSYKITLIGLNDSQMAELPDGITGIKKTNNIAELVKFYNEADLFINPTYDDNYPTTNLEAQACGTPLLVYDTGGTAESVSSDTGVIVKTGDLDNLIMEIQKFRKIGKSKFTMSCLNKAALEFNQENCFSKYIQLYDSICTH